jgi:hypothetical protein
MTNGAEERDEATGWGRHRRGSTFNLFRWPFSPQLSPSAAPQYSYITILSRTCSKELLVEICEYLNVFA